MRSATVVARLILLSVMLALPAAAFAQEAAITGTVTDSTGAVLPGVTVTATNSATGNTFVGVTDDRGNYRIPVRVGDVPDDRGAARVCDRPRQRTSSCSSVRRPPSTCRWRPRPCRKP